MLAVILAPNVLKASMYAHALQRHNIKSMILTFQGIRFFWSPEVDAVLFPFALEPQVYPLLENFFKQVPPKIPFIFLCESHRCLFENGRHQDYLAQSIFFDETLPLSFLPGLLKEIMNKKPLNQRDVQVGPFVLNRLHRTVQYEGKLLLLSKKEFFLLELLILNSGQIVTRENIIDYVWDKRDYVASNTIDVYMSRLRKKLDESSELIQTHPCLGYQLNLP